MDESKGNKTVVAAWIKFQADQMKIGGWILLAEINHKIFCDQEDELTGNFFGVMRYLPFRRGLKPIFENYIKSDDQQVKKIIAEMTEDEFLFEFWKRSELGLGEIDAYMENSGKAVGIEVKYHSALSGEDQLEREAAMLEEWSKSEDKLLIFIAMEEDAGSVYRENKNKLCFQTVHLAYITWQDVLLGMDAVITETVFEEKMTEDLRQYLVEKGFVSFDGFAAADMPVLEGCTMNGENIHNAFAVVFKTLECIQNLMVKCRTELEQDKYYMPADRFMRYSSDSSWVGWIYWSFILLYQRKEDGEIMDNGWINAPVYAVEINVDAETCDEPVIYVAKMDFGDISEWLKGCSPSAYNHGLFYNAIHANNLYSEEEEDDGTTIIRPKEVYREKVAEAFWGFQWLIRTEMNLVDVTQSNYKEKIFGAIESLADK